MPNVTAIYPGTFSPVTYGHLDIIQRSAKIFTKVVVAVADSPHKKPMFSLEERLTLIHQNVDAENVELVGFDGLLVNLCREVNAGAIIRGLRAVSDFEYEFQLAQVNRQLAEDIETMFLTPDEHLMFISSSIVREVSKLGGDVSKMVPDSVEKALIEKHSERAKSS